uniref:Uncharacterized protein n=1 Tax=Panagrolaimus davidi TaxID=227884 RepID=A0A914PZU7_9BILA
MYRPQPGMQQQRARMPPPQMQQQQQRMGGNSGMPAGNYQQQPQQQMQQGGGGQPSQQQSRGQPPQQQQQQAPPPQVSPQIPQPQKSRACATNDKIEKSRFATKESEYATKFANRYKDATFQSKEKMPEPFIWVNMPSQNLKSDRNRQRDNKKKGKNNDDYYRDREPRGRY